MKERQGKGGIFGFGLFTGNILNFHPLERTKISSTAECWKIPIRCTSKFPDGTVLKSREPHILEWNIENGQPATAEKAVADALHAAREVASIYGVIMDCKVVGKVERGKCSGLPDIVYKMPPE